MATECYLGCFNIGDALPLLFLPPIVMLVLLLWHAVKSFYVSRQGDDRMQLGMFSQPSKKTLNVSSMLK